jgi:hypothetical protein
LDDQRKRGMSSAWTDPRYRIEANAELDGRKRDPPNDQLSVVLGHATLVASR